MSRNLVELVRRHHAVDAPSALEVLKEAVELRGELTDEDRREAARRSGLPEAAVHGVSTFYDDLLQPRGARHVRVCTGTACFAATGDAHVDALREAFGLQLGERSADKAVSLAETVCLGFCHSSPAVRDGETIDAGPDVVARVLAGTTRAASEPAWQSLLDKPVLTRRPDGAYAGLARALAELTPEQLLAEVEAADVRGRGGAGFPAGTKWGFARAAPGADKFIVANGDEGDPGSYIDKYLMERSPELLIEGLALAGYAVGASHGFVLVRSEYPLSKPALEAAAARARVDGWLGEDVRGSGFAFDVTIVEGAGSYVVGEETALLACLQGLRGTVSARPPFPAERGVHGLPTVVNNVETLANIPFVAARGADAYRALSPGATPGSKLVCFNERFARPGVYEVRFGTPMRELCEDVAGGLRDGRAIKALQIGGPLGGVLPAQPARHAVRLRRARGRGLHARPRRDPRLRRPHEHARRRATPAALRRARELRQVLPLPHRAAARARAVRGRRAAGRPRAARGAAGDAGARLAVRARRRHAGADPLAAALVPGRAGAGGMSGLHVTVDGVAVEVPVGATLLDAARAAGSWVPTLCFDERQEPFGACRVCLVGVEGGARPLPACTTPCRDGMVVASEDPAARRVAGAVVELVLSELPEPPAPHTELAQVADALGVGEPRWPGATHAPTVPDTRHPYLAFRPELCISCGRCVRACDELQGTFALTATGRGFHANVAAGLDEGFRDSACVSCGACADTCPTEAISERFLLEGRGMTVTTTCGYCGVGCRLDAHVRGDGIASITPAPDGPANLGHTCLKGRFAHRFSRHRERLTTPLIRDARGAAPRRATWDEAIERIVSELTRIGAAHGPDAIAGLASSRATNEDCYAMQRLMRAAIGTNNIDNCSRVCHSPTSYALRRSLGLSGATGSFSDFDHADATLLIGANPTEGHPVVGARIKQATLRGMQLVTIDPRRIELADYGVLHLAPRPGTNAAVLLGIAHVVARDGFVDRDFVAARTETDGFDALLALLPQYAPAAVEAISGVPAARPGSSRARLRGGRERVLLVGPRRDRAQVRLGGRAADLQRRADDRQGRPPGLRAAAAARAEQRAGLLRHGRAAGHLHGIPLGDGRARCALVRSRLGRAALARARAENP